MHNIDSVALELFKEITEKDEKALEAQAGLQKICVLGHHKTQEENMVKIATELCNKNYPATTIGKIPGGYLPDFEKEKRILEKAEVLAIIDDDRGGVVSECTFLIINKQRFFLVHNKNIEAVLEDIKKIK